MAAPPPTVAAPAGTGQGEPELVPPRKSHSGFFHEVGELTVFSARAMVAAALTPRYFSEVLGLTARIIKRTSFLLLAMNVFLGFSVASFGFFFLRTIGAGDFVGVFTGLLTQRQVPMTMYGYVLSASICCAMTAEIGAAKIQQEIDAYESTGVDPMQLIVGVRVLAAMLFVPLATVISLIGQNLGNYLDIVVVLQGNGSRQFLDVTFSVQSMLGQFYTLITFFFMTLPCVLVATFYGMRASGGPADVGRAVAKSLMINLVLVHVISAFFGVFFYGRNLNIPIGD
ncbi:ABC transporter permease [Patulibacter brassicae]|jgi:phospholipid/cholesterol/gamma-HCH transport system permease protein|uniref:ABC transporter permease n=1 Tax=Patulibacter brassicae TaxID=1705717 RepID=A0ABU4VRJ1_9ACTN|nr:ABC transporter permease [Patulibacter brassicae]MDX8153724.1 ABC transporter permease [Patulibacter brassicae]